MRPRDQKKSAKAAVMYKVINGIAPDYLQELFVPVNEAHNYNLRFSDMNVKIPQPHTEYHRRSLSYSGARLWNSLLSTIKSLPKVNTFSNVINAYTF